MSKTETPVSQLKINRLTKTQFDSASDLSDTELYAVDPQFTGGKLLKTDSNGDIVESTATETDTLPSQSGQSGKFLTTNGTTASWGNVPTEIPSQSGQSGKYLTTNGTSVSWGSITIPTVNNATLTIQKNSTNVATFTANSSSNVTANITVPTDTNDLTNGAGYITSSALSNLADKDLSNLTATGKSTSASLAMPSGSSTSLTLGASGASYTATDNGYFFMDGIVTAQGGSAYISASNMTIGDQNYLVNGPIWLILPVQKGYSATVVYDSFTAFNFKFIKAQGDA